MSEELRQTALFDEHVRLGGKIVPFAGFGMPVQYPTGITEEHRTVRQRAGLFDVSHMGEFVVRGPDALTLVQRISINDPSRIAIGQAQYSAMCLESGGVLDDLLVYRFPDRFMLVVNASNLRKDWTWIVSHADDLDAELEDVSVDTALLALQGPAARQILTPLSSVDLERIGYYRFLEGEISGIPATISATGYTGEDGFELYVLAHQALALWTSLMQEGSSYGLVPAGLGARDSLRLEMGYALYGNELDEEHTPLEAGLGWITKLEERDFIGRDALLTQKRIGLARCLVGLVFEGRGFPRSGYPILSGGEIVGALTSGTVSPSLGVGIGMGYVPAHLSAQGTELQVNARGRMLDGVVVRPPFYTEGSIRR